MASHQLTCLIPLLLLLVLEGGQCFCYLAEGRLLSIRYLALTYIQDMPWISYRVVDVVYRRGFDPLFV